MKKRRKIKISNTQISLAGEFAVLSQLALQGYDANMTLGNTKGIDILVSDPRTKKMYQLEVKTNVRNEGKKLANSRVHGKYLSGWMMNKKQWEEKSPSLYYCFVNIVRNKSYVRFYIVPSRVVAEYIKKEHVYYLRYNRKRGRNVKDTDMCQFRIGLESEKYPKECPMPTAEQYENNWEFKN